MMTDPIADMLTRIRNGLSARRQSVLVPHSKLKFSIAGILVREKYIASAKETIQQGKPVIEIGLRYAGTAPAITAISRISKPGRRIYRKSDELRKVLNGYGIAIVSTPQGLLTNVEAEKAGVGGEVICEIY